jgi:hypothetical protein
MIQKQRADSQQQQPPPPPPSSQDEGYWAYMQRQINERTEKLNIVGDSMDKLEESSSGFAEDVGKFVSSQKRKVILGSMSFPPPHRFIFSGREIADGLTLCVFVGIKGKFF